ncbi:MAG: PorT family protein [Bacteroidetes bacterium]|nr:PorT family protein [Bacteroidota bacterium]
MTRLFSFLTILTIHLTALGQHNIGLKVDGGLSKISTNFSSQGTSVYNNNRFSGNCGLFYNYHLTQKSLIAGEFLLIQIGGTEYHNKPILDTLGNPMGISFVDNFYRRITYIGLPIYYGLKIKKLTINIGVQTSFALTNKETHESYIQYPKSSNPSGRDIFGKLSIDNYDFGARLGISYDFTDIFGIETKYYYGINNIYKNNDYSWKVRQMTVGLHLKIFTSKRESETEKK